MPGRNGMGPMGQGSMTGRGMGWGGGRGGGWRHRQLYQPTGLTEGQRPQTGWPEPGPGRPPVLSEEQELAALKQEAESLERTLDELTSRMRELDGPAPDATTGKESR